MQFFKTPLAIALLALTPFVSSASAQTPTASSIKIGFQRSSTLVATLKANGGLEDALKPLKVSVTWNEFTSGLPLLEALNLGNIDFSADVADTVPVFAQAAGARLAYVAEEAPSPSAQAILVPSDSPIRSVADLKGKKVAVTKGAAKISDDRSGIVAELKSGDFCLVPASLKNVEISVTANTSFLVTEAN